MITSASMFIFMMDIIYFYFSGIFLFFA